MTLAFDINSTFSIDPTGVIAIVVFAIVGLICYTLNKKMGTKNTSQPDDQA